MTKTAVVDADTHFYEPKALWDDYLDPEFRDSAPQWVTDETGALRLHLEGKEYPARGTNKKGVGHIFGDGMVHETMLAGNQAGPRLAEMDAWGVDVHVIYPTAGMLGFSQVQDPRLAGAMARAYNRWASEFAAADPHRLRPAALLPTRHPEVAAAELRYARETLNLGLAFANPTPPVGLTWSDSAFDDLWSTVEDLDVIMTFHEGSGGSTNAVGIGRYNVYAFNYLCSHVVEVMLAAMDILVGGVLDRHPRMRVGFVEAHIAWVPGWLALLDDVAKKTALSVVNADLVLQGLPTDYFKRSCYVTAFADDAGLAEVIAAVGTDCVAMSSDYPHPQARGMSLTEAVEKEHPDLTPQVRAELLSGGKLEG
jgi:predicted TIM-barrel fold metal-dependent hydrolase